MQNSLGQLIEERVETTLGTRKALIISISDYNSNQLHSLNFCKNDGEEMYKLLESLGYEITDNQKHIGSVNFETMRGAIFDFFNNAKSIGEDTLLFYYSGHGVPAPDGDVCLASSEIDTDDPYRRGFSSFELTRLMHNSVSLRIVAILDCCYSGAARVSKGMIGKAVEDAAARIGTNALEDKAKLLEQQGEGKCILSASQATQEAFALKEGENSIFTYYLLDGLKGKKKSVDTNGNVTPSTLGNYIYRAIMNLPPGKRPKQKPITKAETSGDIILASYPKLAVARSIPTPSPPQIKPPIKPKEGKPWIKPKILIPIAAVSIVGIIIALNSISLPPIDNHYPVALNNSVTTITNIPIAITLAASDQDSDDDLKARIVSPPSDGELSNINQQTGMLTYSPDLDFMGADSFRFRVNDGSVDSNNTGTVRIVVNQPPKNTTTTTVANYPPITNNQSVTTNLNKAVDILLAASDQNQNDDLTASIITDPSHGKLSEINQSMGIVTYTPNPGFTGTDEFTFKVNDGKVDSQKAGIVKVDVAQ